MPRIKLDIPQRFPFSTEIAVRITDVNYGGHLGNDALLSLIHEARVRFLAQFGYTEMNIEGQSIIMADAAIVFKSEAFRGDILRFEVAAVDFHRFGCDLFYEITHVATGREVARAKTGIVFFDYSTRKLAAVPPAFEAKLTTESTTTP